MRFRKYILYFFIVVLAGGAGCWISLAQYLLNPSCPAYSAFIGNLATFAISVAFLALADQILDTSNSASARGLFLLILVMATLGFSAFSMLVTSVRVTIPATIGVIVALICWSIVNLHNRALIDPVSALGGEIDAEH